MKIQLPQYTSKDYLVLGITILPMTLILNSLIFGLDYYSNALNFIFTTILTAIAFGLDFTICGSIAVQMKKRFPSDNQVERRLTIMIFSFIIITGLFLFGIFRFYELFPFLHYTFNDDAFVWAYIGMGILNIFLTFLHEGIARYENWKANQVETESLKKVYRQTRLQGLKSQVNPHFLFNSLNSLSSLIHEDQQKGEKFLNEMSKLYRYMLQNDEETMVQLATELKFLDSYIHILMARHNEGLKVNIIVPEEKKELWLPPLTLQSIIENIVVQNSICRDCPLEIDIIADADNNLTILNNIIPRMQETNDHAPSLDNIVQKYRLLNRRQVTIAEDGQHREIRIPLLEKKEEVLI
jgi:two-component system LytT family sensor kinase